MPGPELHVGLDAPLPETLAVGAGTAVFVAGWCTAGEGRIDGLQLVVDGRPQPVTAHGMPRLDVLRALHPGEDPYAVIDPGSYRSGFWGMARVGPRARAAEVTLGLRARLLDGREVDAQLARMAVEVGETPVALPALEPSEGPLVAVCMATYDPPRELLRRQLDSLRAQTHRRWVCVISDDCSDPRRFADLQAAVGDDPRFVVSRSPRRLGFYRNFERALRLAPAEATHVALADQDDAWHPDKLEALLGALGQARLVYSDARLVSPAGAVLAGTYWSRRRNNHADLRSLLVANAVTGAASLVARELLEVALPFPPAQFAHFHDHWLALCARSLGPIAYVERPLYDYVQHGAAVLGHAAANRVTALRDRLGSLRDDPRGRIRLWRATYFVDVARLSQLVTVLLLRAGDRMSPAERRVLEGFLRAADGSLPAVAGLWVRGVRDLAGRPETLGAERGLAYAMAWRRLLGATARDRPTRRLRLDAVPPATLAPRPGHRAPEGPVRVVADKVAPLDLAVRDDEPERVNVLIPTIDLEHLFAGYIGKFNLALSLARRGRRVRIVTVDPVPPLRRGWERQVERYEGLDGLFDRVEVAFGREAAGGLPVSRTDRFVATTWWSAHAAHAAVRALGGGRFLYLVQEYEPFTFPMGTWAALAEQSYRFPHTALFSTELLREYFRRHGYGVYAAGTPAGDAASASFQNAITTVAAPDAAALRARRTRRLLFYARPEPHAARNLFELGVLALGRAHADGVFRDGWELRGIGTVALGRRLALGEGGELELLARSAQDDYGRLLGEHDVGLALMHTPHPSLVPIEMAAAGLVTVTSTFEHKTAAALAAISPNLVAAEPTVEEVAAALADAVAAADDAAHRIAGSDVAWSRSWATSFDAGVLDRVEALLGGPEA